MLDQVQICDDDDLAMKLGLSYAGTRDLSRNAQDTSIGNDITADLSQLPEYSIEAPNPHCQSTPITSTFPAFSQMDLHLAQMQTCRDNPEGIPPSIDDQPRDPRCTVTPSEVASPLDNPELDPQFQPAQLKRPILPTGALPPGVSVPTPKQRSGKRVSFFFDRGGQEANPNSLRPNQPPGGSSSSNGSNGLAASSELSRFQSRLEDLRKWSLSTYKCTRQIISEKLGKGSRTVDPELEAQIEILRETQVKYLNVLRLARAMWTHFNNVVTTQRQLADSFTELGQKSPELQEEFAYNAETQKALVRNGETLLGALNFFISSINTLCNKTMEDTLSTVKAYETARIEYDAYRNEMEIMNPSITTQPSAGAAPSPNSGLGDPSAAARALDTQANFSMHKDKFEKLRSDVTIKLKFLDENKIKVMHKQLLLFHNAISAYFSGNQSALDATLKQFNIKLKVSGDKPSWLEQQ